MIEMCQMLLTNQEARETLACPLRVPSGLHFYKQQGSVEWPALYVVAVQLVVSNIVLYLVWRQPTGNFRLEIGLEIFDTVCPFARCR